MNSQRTVRLRDMAGHGASSARSKRAKAWARRMMKLDGRTPPDETNPSVTKEAT